VDQGSGVFARQLKLKWHIFFFFLQQSHQPPNMVTLCNINHCGSWHDAIELLAMLISI